MSIFDGKKHTIGTFPAGSRVVGASPDGLTIEIELPDGCRKHCTVIEGRGAGPSVVVETSVTRVGKFSTTTREIK